MSETLRIAIRKFGPFEDAIRRQFADFKTVTGSPYELEPVSLDLNPLVDTLFTQGGLREGFWDVAFIVTDWLAEAIADGCLARPGAAAGGRLRSRTIRPVGRPR